MLACLCVFDARSMAFIKDEFSLRENKMGGVLIWLVVRNKSRTNSFVCSETAMMQLISAIIDCICFFFLLLNLLPVDLRLVDVKM